MSPCRKEAFSVFHENLPSHKVGGQAWFSSWIASLYLHWYRLSSVSIMSPETEQSNYLTTANLYLEAAT